MALLVLLVFSALGLIALSFAFPDHFREYRRYLTDKRPPMDFSFLEISEDWSEADLKAHFYTQKLSCYAEESGVGAGGRSCYVDIASHNDAPAMSIVFFFKKDHLQKAFIRVPWWGHSSMLESIRKHYGASAGFLEHEAPSGPVLSWRLENGSALFYNRDVELNPVKWSLVLWLGERECIDSKCFAKLRPGEP